MYPEGQNSIILRLLVAEIGILKILPVYYLNQPLDERIHQNLKSRRAGQFKRNFPQYGADDRPVFLLEHRQ
jgi:hypothetical protein